MAGPAQRLLKRGGARRTGYGEKLTTALSERDCERLIKAARRAERLGRPFNRFVTLLWERGGVEPMRNRDATSAFVKLYADWLRRKGNKSAWAYVQEWGAINGAHVHLLLHVPEKLDDEMRRRRLAYRWATQCLPGKYVSGVVETQTIRHGRDPATSVDAYRANLMGKVHYMLKSAPVELEHQSGMTSWRSPWSRDWGKSCETYGKRLNVWQERRL